MNSDPNAPGNMFEQPQITFNTYNPYATSLTLGHQQDQLDHNPLNLEPHHTLLQLQNHTPSLLHTTYDSFSLYKDQPSTRSLEIYDQPDPHNPIPSDSKKLEPDSQVRTMILYLLRHPRPSSDKAFTPNPFHFSSPILAQTFRILSNKFRSLHKTKQELTKYCMRKAFKFISDRQPKTDRPQITPQPQTHQPVANNNSDHDSLSVPFKKQSATLTMNKKYLKDLFACRKFSWDYHEFLYDFPQIIREDNEAKVITLTKVVEEAIAQGQPTQVENMQRLLPWTNQLMHQAVERAKEIAEQVQTEGRRNKQTKH